MEKTSEPLTPDAAPRIPVILLGREVQVTSGTPVGEILRAVLKPPKPGRPVLAAIVQNRCVDLDFPVSAPTEIIPVDYSTREGVLVYRRTASLILLEAARRLHPRVRVSVGQAMGNGYFYNVRTPSPITAEEVSKLDATMREIIAADLPISLETRGIDEARGLFRSLGFEDKLRLLKTWWEPFVPLVRLGEFWDIHHSPVAPSTGYIRTFELRPYAHGLVLRFAPRHRPDYMRPFEDTPKLFRTYKETRQWNEILGVETVGRLNELTIRGDAGDLIRIAEGLHEKKITEIADQIQRAKDRIRLVLVAGPSASGKTTFSKRLSLQLVVNGLRPVALSTDNFYVDRPDTPKDADGKYDFEAIEAIDLALFNEVLSGLLKGERVQTPRFDFTTGLRRPRDKWPEMQLEPGQVLVVEGIHGLNDRLTQAVADEHKFRVYVSALTQLCVDDHNRIFTSDTRFLRRIVRDRRFRGYTAASTIESWPSVRRGEQQNIFPYQERADVMFNSALVYEQALLRLYAERYLLEVPQDHASFLQAYRLLKFMQLFVPIFDEQVPQISILREFIGGSAFKY
jgi:uridine kinase